MKKLIVLFLVGTITSSCISNFKAVTLTENLKKYEIDPKEVKIFTNMDKLPEKEDIAILEISNTVLDGDYYSDMKEESAKIGGNGIIELSDKNTGISLDLYNLEVNKKRTVKFLSFRYKIDGSYPKIYSKKKEGDSLYN